MNKMQINYVLELQSLRNRIVALENQLQSDAQCNEELPRVFEVTLRVQTCVSSWAFEYVNTTEIDDLFSSYANDMAEALHLNDKGDEIKVLRVTEVT